MTKISHLREEERRIAFGYGNPDASDGVLYRSNNSMNIDTHQHTLFIGIGGEGCRVVNNIKQTVIGQYANWQG